MVTPSPYPSRDVGDPQVIKESRFVRRCPLRRFLFLTGEVRRKDHQNTNTVLMASDAGIGISWACKPES